MSQIRRITIKCLLSHHPKVSHRQNTSWLGDSVLLPPTKGFTTITAEMRTQQPSLSGRALAGRLEAVGSTQECFLAGCGKKVAQGEVSQPSGKNNQGKGLEWVPSVPSAQQNQVLFSARKRYSFQPAHQNLQSRNQLNLFC